MGTLGVELGTGEIFYETADPAAASTERENATGITHFSTDFREEQVLVAKLFHHLIHKNTDIDYHIMGVPREHLCKGPVKSLFMPSHASLYLQPACLIVSRPYL